MDVIEFRPDREQYAFTFGGVAPVRKVRPGTMLRLWTDDAFCGNLRDPADMPSAKLTMPFVNPQTGPFYVEGQMSLATVKAHVSRLLAKLGTENRSRSLCSSRTPRPAVPTALADHQAAARHRATGTARMPVPGYPVADRCGTRPGPMSG
jgi:hypothetical protein